MRRRELIRILKRIAGEVRLDLVLTEGGSHTKARIGPWMTTIPRHREVDESLARSIIRNCRSTLQEES